MAALKKCPKGHTYRADLPECPICKGRDHEVTADISNLYERDADLKTMIDEEVAPVAGTELDPHQDYSRTVIEEDVDEKDEQGNIVSRIEVRPRLRLVGWLVTYSLDKFGVDFRLYEGRSIIGKDMSCDVCISDPKVSGQHAILLYRGGKFKIRDNLSTNGTIVNSEDIEDNTCELHDGDIIQVGETVLLFRSAILSNEE